MSIFLTKKQGNMLSGLWDKVNSGNIHQRLILRSRGVSGHAG